MDGPASRKCQTHVVMENRMSDRSGNLSKLAFLNNVISFFLFCFFPYLSQKTETNKKKMMTVVLCLATCTFARTLTFKRKRSFL